MKSALVNNAKRPVFSHVDGVTPTDALTRGGGRIDLAEAANPEALFDPASVSFGLHTGNRRVTETRVISICSAPGGSFSFTATGTIPVDLEMSFSPDEATLGAGDCGEVEATLSASRSSDLNGNHLGDIEVTGGGDTFLLPWLAGFENR